MYDPPICQFCSEKIYLGQLFEHSDKNTVTQPLHTLDADQLKFLTVLGCSYADGEVLDFVKAKDRVPRTTNCGDCGKPFDDDTLNSEIAIGEDQWKHTCFDCLPTVAYSYSREAITWLLRAAAGTEVPRLQS